MLSFLSFNSRFEPMVENIVLFFWRSPLVKWDRAKAQKLNVRSVASSDRDWCEYNPRLLLMRIRD